MAVAPVGDALRGRVLRGLAWSAGTAIFLHGSRFAFAVILARLLTPRDYGLAAMALVFSALVLLVSDFGLSDGLVQRAEISEADRSTVFWVGAGVGLLLTAAGIALAGPVASFFDEPQVRPLFMVVSISFVVTGLGRAHAALYQRELRFRAISVRVIAATLAGGTVGIGVAVLGYGAWALVAQSTTIAFASTALLWVMSPWRPRLVFSTTSLRNLGSFGLRVFGARFFLDFLNSNTDKMMIGRFLGSAPLGIYSIAFSLIISPLSMLLIAVVDTLFPALSKIQHEPERLRNVWTQVARFVTAAVAPAMVGIVVVAPDLVPVLLGDRWRPAIPVVQILAFTTLLGSISRIAVTMLMSLDRVRLLLRFSACEFPAVVAAIALGLQWGVVEVAAFFTAAVIVTRAVLIALTLRVLGIPRLRFAASLLGVAQAALVMGAAAWLTQALLAPAPGAARLAATIVVGITVYMPLVLWRAPELRLELRRMMRRSSDAATPAAR